MRAKTNVERGSIAIRVSVTASGTPLLWPAFKAGSAQARRERALQLLTLGLLLEQSLIDSVRPDASALLERVLAGARGDAAIRPSGIECEGNGGEQKRPQASEGEGYLSQMGTLLPEKA